ncbi:TetR/AcrR family transcriptional regulator [Protaetiibacter larvae]|uniref:TetR family transcriptional regulator n=1 Tax=Protaetiibacter larvae TaxID=2592654 RepID=A0A5C1Y871_9MICO|nr:TetR family transcriptional regulator C-terminal domain-containing protein [Protaetiibacter larvae]QEO09558.1 TetR family transcriptional regulator [Protaetiibacter larvae]
MTRMPATERRAALARAALVVVDRDGVHAATTRAIVAEAAMPLASFHYAVPSRDELLRDVVELVVDDESDAALAGLLAEAVDVRDAIRRTLTAYLDHVRLAPGREQAMFELTQYALRTPELADLPAEQYGRYHATAATLLTAAEAHLGIRWVVPVAALARLIVTLTDGITLAWLADRDDAAAENTIDLATDALAPFAQPAP